LRCLAMRMTCAPGEREDDEQFAAFAAPVANHWFGGGLAALYAALGEKSPGQPARIDLLVGDPLGFVRAVFTTLGGGPAPNGGIMSGPGTSKDRKQRRRSWMRLREP
jgi:hypothetical protein